jgi:AraC-like DNA-binding protein
MDLNFYANEGFVLNEFIEIPLAYPSFYMEQLLLLRKNYSLQNTNNNADCLSIIYKIIARIIKESDANNNSLIDGVIEYMDEFFYDKNIDNAVLASKANISSSHFRFLFKKKTGVSPMSYLQNLRIEKAKQQLLYSNSSITEISEKCGFSNLYSFSRSFKSVVGLSPQNFAKQNKINLL